MKSRSRVLALLIVLGLAAPSVATDAAPRTVAEMAQRADLVVVGLATREKAELSIRVSEVLKGPRADLVVLNSAVAGPFREVVVRPGDEGVFFLNKNGAGYEPMIPWCYKEMKEVNAVRLAVEMLADPGPYLDAEKFPESLDIIYVLGNGFTGWTVASKEIPNYEWREPTFYEEAPWEEKRVVTVQFTTDAQDKFQLSATAEPQSALGEYVKYRLLMNSKSPETRRALPTRFSVTLDARPPERVGSATAEKARLYLRDRLASPDSEMVLAAILALAKMRDQDAGPHVLLLLGHEDARVKVKATEFLGWSRDEHAVKPLCTLLDAKAARYPEDHAICNAAATALGQIGGEESLPHLEQAACHGVERAMTAVGKLGREGSFEVLLTALENNPSRLASIDSTLYWLVRRSNMRTESWMAAPATTTQAIQIARIPNWRAWWNANKKDFKVIKSLDEAVLERIWDN